MINHFGKAISHKDMYICVCVYVCIYIYIHTHSVYPSNSTCRLGSFQLLGFFCLFVFCFFYYYGEFYKFWCGQKLETA